METFADLPATLVSWVTSIFGTNPSGDFVLLIVCGVLVVLIGLWGRALLGTLLVASYGAMALLSVTPLLGWIQSGLHVPATVWGTAGVVLGVAAVFFAVVSYALGDVLADDESSMVASMVVGIAIVGMLAAFLFTLLPAGTVETFAPITRVLLTGGVAMLLWMLAPLTLIAATRG